MHVHAVGLPWYSRESYGRVREVMQDGHLLPVRYESWLECATSVLLRVERAGLVAMKVFIDLDEFERWCRWRGLERAAEARNEFVDYVIGRVAGGDVLNGGAAAR